MRDIIKAVLTFILIYGIFIAVSLLMYVLLK